MPKGIIFLGGSVANFQRGFDRSVRFIKAFILPQSMWQGAMQLGIILVMCLISVYRPTSFRHWKKTEK